MTRKHLAPIALSSLLWLAPPVVATSLSGMPNTGASLSGEAVAIDLRRPASAWATGTDLALDPTRMGADLDLVATLKARRGAAERVGERRMRALDTAYFHLYRSPDAPGVFDADYAEEESERILLSCVGKLARKHLEERSGFAAWRDGLGEGKEQTEVIPAVDATPARIRWRISPRFRLGGNDAVGVRVRAKDSQRPKLARWHVGIRHYVDDGSTALRGGYSADALFLRVELRPDSEETGNRVALSGGWRF